MTDVSVCTTCGLKVFRGVGNHWWHAGHASDVYAFCKGRGITPHHKAIPKVA